MPLIRIEKRDKDSNARTGVLTLPHGDVSTPVFMPVGTNATVKAMLHESLAEIGYKLILGNTYHLYLRPGIDVINKHGGLHQFSSWQDNILTDSGGYQIFSLAAFRKVTSVGAVFRSHLDGATHRLTPESVVDIQTNLGSDIQMQLDFCTPPDIDKREASEALQITTDWAALAKKRWLEKKPEYRGLLFGIVQGNFFKELRKKSVESLVELALPGYGIGGLSVGEEPSLFREILHYTVPLLPEDKPKYVMGIGTPDYMLEAVEAGVDMFDCVYPTRVARNGSAFTEQGIINLRNARYKYDDLPVEDSCSCIACRNYSCSYIRHLFMAREILGPMLLSYHNLQFLFQMMRDVRVSIEQHRFMEFKKEFLNQFSRWK